MEYIDILKGFLDGSILENDEAKDFLTDEFKAEAFDLLLIRCKELYEEKEILKKELYGKKIYYR